MGNQGDIGIATIGDTGAGAECIFGDLSLSLSDIDEAPDRCAPLVYGAAKR